MSGTPPRKERSPQTVLYARQGPVCERNPQKTAMAARSRRRNRRGFESLASSNQVAGAAAVFFLFSLARRDFVRAAAFL